MTEHRSQVQSGEKVIGVTHDPILRPIGILMTIVGGTWALFSGMALQAGSYHQPLAAAGLMLLGVLMAGAGAPTEQI